MTVSPAGEAELFASITLHRLGIIAHSFDGQLAAVSGFYLGGDFLFQPKDFCAHALVLFDEREIPNGDSDHAAMMSRNTTAFVSLSQIPRSTLLSLMRKNSL